MVQDRLLFREKPMCPVCIATAAANAGSATGTGGLTASLAKRNWEKDLRGSRTN